MCWKCEAKDVVLYSKYTAMIFTCVRTYLYSQVVDIRGSEWQRRQGECAFNFLIETHTLTGSGLGGKDMVLSGLSKDFIKEILLSRSWDFCWSSRVMSVR